MKKILLLIGFVSLTMNAQAPSIQWQKTLGGTGYDNANSIQQTADGGYIVTGNTQSNDGDLTGNHGGQDVWVMKLNSVGTIQWQKTLGGTGNETSNSIQQTTDGGYILAGSTTSNNGDVSGNHGSNDFWVVKLNSAGIIQWQKALGGLSNDQGYSVRQTSDDGYIVVGSTTSVDGDVIGGVSGNATDIWVVKLNSVGDITMQKKLGGLGNEIAYSVQQTSDGYLLAGSTDLSSNTFVVGNGGYDAWVMKINNSGSIIWKKAYGGNSDDYFYSIQQTTDGNYILAGSSDSNNGDVTGNHGGDDFWVVKIFSSNGDVQWQNSFGGTGGEKAKSVQQTTDGGYIIVGATDSSDGDLAGNNIGVGGANTWIVKLYNNGTLQWQETLEGSGAEIGNSIQQTTDGGYIIAGFTNSNDGDVIGNHGNFDAWVVKLELDPTPTAGFCQAFTFSDLNNMNIARGLISSTTDGSNIYVCNGFSPAVNYTTQIEKYNIATNTWSVFSNTNAGLRYSSAEVVGNKLYVFNGIPSSTTFNNKMEVIDLTTGVVTYSTDNPSPVYSAGSSVWDGKIYSFGGTGSSGNSAKLYVFDPLLQTWTQLADMPQAKQCKGEIINGKLYVIGGFDGSSLTGIDCYDIQNNTWSHLMDMPASNSANATSVFQNKIWVIGD
ncbi:kelch repeat-containing protein [Flavobacterium sp.]|uniref:Kelch repeat-containing protein n=1 Tax=Flavobacterium sp. TaxID=239 RepID=UPI0025D2F58C|nr:kelch repeat-containing protein [Flavobacterium sp.]